MSKIVDPFSQNKSNQAQQLRDLSAALTQAGAAKGQANVAAAQTELQGALLQQKQRNFESTQKQGQDNFDRDQKAKRAAVNQAQVNALKRIEAQGKQTRQTQEEGITQRSDATAKQKAASQATFNKLIGKEPETANLPASRSVTKPTPASGEVPPRDVGTPAKVSEDLSKRPPPTVGDIPLFEEVVDTLEGQLENALASPDEDAGRKAALLLDTKLSKMKGVLKGLKATAIFDRRRTQLSQALDVPEGAITPENLTKFETEFVNKITETPDIPGSTDVTLQFLAKFPEWRNQFAQMQAEGATEIDLSTPEIKQFLNENRRMFNTFAENFITKQDKLVDPITSKQAILYRSERDKFLRALEPMSELKANIEQLKDQAKENYVWDATIEVSPSLRGILSKMGLTADVYDEDEVGQLEEALVRMQVESVNPLLKSVENIILNSPIEVQALFQSELSERLNEADIPSNALSQVEANLAAAAGN